jgi:putative heme transporter
MDSSPDGRASVSSALSAHRRAPAHRPDAVDGVTWPVRVASAWTWRLLVIGIGVYALVRIFSRVWLVVFSFILALFLTAVLHPLERRLRSLISRPRSAPALISLLIGVAALVGIGWFVEWQISRHASELGDQISALVDHAKDWLRNGPLHLKSSDLDKISNNITNTVKEHPGQLLSGALATVRAVSEFFAALLLILLSTFYLLRDGELVWRWVVSLFPRAAQERVDRAGAAGWLSFGGYMRGQLLVALFHGVTITILLVALRVPLAAALGVLIFLASFIPLVGLTVTGALAIAVALLEHGLISAIVVAVAIIVLVQVEAHLLQPFIMSRSVKVHPLAVVLAVVAGTTLGGIPGAFVAVPLIAFLNTTVRSLRAAPDEPAHPASVAAEYEPDRDS